MNRAAKAEENLKRTCEKLGIGESGREWFEVAIDPFGDMVRHRSGYPDKIMTPSIVQKVHGSFTVAAPGAVAWDANIFMDQFYLHRTLYSTTSTIDGVFERSGQASVQKRGGLVVRSGTAGSPLSLADTTHNQLFPSDVFTDADARVIGCGFEIHNTTAELYKQGAVICWRSMEVPEIKTGTFIGSQATPGVSTSLEYYDLVEPPISATEAIDLPDSVQWEAKDGAYIIPIFVQEDNEPSELKQLPVYSSDSSLHNINQITLTGTINHITLASSQNYMLPTSLSGAYFTGLSPQTELTVNYILYVEVFPSITNILRRSTMPSAPEDIKAIELYTKVVRKLPPGVPVEENFLAGFIQAVSRIAQGLITYTPQIMNTISSISTATKSMGQAYGTVQKAITQGQEIVTDVKKTMTEMVVSTANKPGTAEVNGQLVLVKPMPGVKGPNLNLTYVNRPLYSVNDRKVRSGRIRKNIILELDGVGAGNKWYSAPKKQNKQ